MQQQDRVRFYYEIYRDELARRDSLDASLRMPSFFLSLMGAGVGYFGNLLLETDSRDLSHSCFFLTSFALSFTFVVWAGYRLLCSFWGVNYDYLVKPSRVEKFLGQR